MPMTAKERQQRWRDKKKSTPGGQAEYRHAEKIRYKRRKETGSRKLVAAMTDREHRMQVRKWRNWKRASNIKQTEIHKDALTPAKNTTETETPISQSSSQSSAHVRGRQKVRKDRSRAYRTIKSLKEELEAKNKLINCYRQRLSRSKYRNAATPRTTPRSKTREQLKSCHVNDKVRKSLLFHNVLISEIESKFNSASSLRQRQELTRVVTGALLKKYRVMHMMKMLGCSDRQVQSGIKGIERKGRSSAVTVDLMRHVHQFYLREDNSRSTSGKKETITRKKVKKQVYILADSCKNLHRKYLFEHEHSKVSYTTFLRLKPFWVVTRSVDSRDTCLCKVCDNLQLKANKMYKERIVTTARLQDLALMFCCSMDNVQCTLGSCSICSKSGYPIHTDMFEKTTVVDIEQSVVWNQWKNVTEKRQQKRSNGDVKEFNVKITKKEEICGTFGELFDSFEDEMRSKGVRHLFTIEHQYKVLRKMKTSLSPCEVVLHIDFAENYNCKLATEIQSFHFGASRNQVTIHNAVAYTSSGILSFSTLSNCMRHDPCAIWCYLKPVLEHLLEVNPAIEIVRFISDSPATQYRCRNNFMLFCTRLYDICRGKLRAASWDYMEAGHGKGAPDGLGAVLKRTADRLVSNGHDLSTADKVYCALNSAQSGIKLFYVADSEVDCNDTILQQKPVKSVTGTMKIRQLHSSSYGTMKHRVLSCYCSDDKYRMCDCFSCATVDFGIGK